MILIIIKILKHLIKSKTKALLTDIHLENSFRIASSQIQLNVEKLDREKQYQLSHKK